MKSDENTIPMETVFNSRTVRVLKSGMNMMPMEE